MITYPNTVENSINDMTTADINNMSVVNGSTTLIDGAIIVQYLNYKYGNYKCTKPIFASWTLYKTLRTDDYMKMAIAVNSNYNPIENYNSEETNVIMRNDGTYQEQIGHGKTTTDTANGVTNENSVTTFEDTTYRPNSKNVQSGSTTSAETGTTTTTKQHILSSSVTVDDVTYSADETEAHINKKSGNIGVTTTQQMIQSEIELRMKNITEMFIDEYVRQYCYCNEGVS